MTDWNALRDSAKPDTLEKIVADIEGALLPMMKAMLPEPEMFQCVMLMDEIDTLYCRVYSLQDEVQNGDANTDP